MPHHDTTRQASTEGPRSAACDAVSVVSAVLSDHGLDRSTNVADLAATADNGRPGLNLPVSDGRTVFAKVSRPGALSGVLAEAVIATELAAQGAEVLTALIATTVTTSCCGTARQVSVWPYLPPGPVGEAIEQVQACVDGIADFARVDAGWWSAFCGRLPHDAPHTAWLRHLLTSKGALDPRAFMDRIELRLATAVGRDRWQARSIGGTAYTGLSATREGLAADLSRAAALAHDRLGRLDAFTSSVLLHGDPHPDNLIWTGNGARLIDLESVCSGPVEHDLGQALHGLVFRGAGAHLPPDHDTIQTAVTHLEQLVRDRVGLEHAGLGDESWERVVWWARLKAVSGASFLLTQDVPTEQVDLAWRRTWQSTTNHA